MEKMEVIIEAKAMLQSVTIFHAIFYFLAKLWQILNVSLSALCDGVFVCCLLQGPRALSMVSYPIGWGLHQENLT